MATPLSLTAVYETVEDGWIQARLEELPEVITVAPSLAEAKTMLEDAVREYIAALLQDSVGERDVATGKRASVEVTIQA